jgi:hypothetical protein
VKGVLKTISQMSLRMEVTLERDSVVLGLGGLGEFRVVIERRSVGYG